MMINLTAVLSIAVGLLAVGGAVVGFFVMQNTQNMRITAVEKEVCRIKDEDIAELKHKMSEQSRYQIATEKLVVRMDEKLDHIMKSIEELKQKK